MRTTSELTLLRSYRGHETERRNRPILISIGDQTIPRRIIKIRPDLLSSKGKSYSIMIRRLTYKQYKTEDYV